MKTILDQRGETSALLLPVIILAILFIGSASFAVWAYSSRQDYKDNVDAKIATAIAANKVVVQQQDAKTYAEAAKNPLKTYVGPDADGGVHVSYPKTWSAYIDTSSNPIDAYFHTDYVPSTDDQTAIYNLRVQVLNSTYDSVVSQYQGYVQGGTATATPYSLPKVPSVTGMRFDGQLFDNNGSGSLVVLPIRNQTLVLWEQSAGYLADFNNYILPNVSFSP